MKKLVLEDNELGRDQFGIIWQAFAIADGGGLQGLDQLHMGLQLMGKLKAISSEGDESMRILNTGEAQVLLLEPAEHNWIKKRLLAVPWKLSGVELALSTIKLVDEAGDYIGLEKLDSTGAVEETRV